MSENHFLRGSTDHLLVPLRRQTCAYEVDLITVISVVIIICSSTNRGANASHCLSHTSVIAAIFPWPGALHQVGRLRRLPLVGCRNELIREQMPTDHKKRSANNGLLFQSLGRSDLHGLRTRGHQRVAVSLLSRASLCSRMRAKGRR